MTLADDLTAIYADPALTVPVVYGGVHGRGFLDWVDVPQQDTAGEITVISQRTVTVQASKFSTLVRDGVITVDGVVYAVHDFRRINDGKELQVVVA